MEINTSDFNKITSLPVGMGAERIEYEEVLAITLNRIIDKGLAIDAPIQMDYNHPEMVKKGYLKLHSGEDKAYSLTLKSIAILHNYCGKTKS